MAGLRIIFFGLPGSGKGTQASLLSKKFAIPVISTGEILRQEITNNSDIGKLAQSFVQQGQLVPDQIVIDIIKAKIANCKQGYILDGFPRNQAQAKALDQANIKIDHVIYIKVAKEDVITRVSGRRLHEPSGRIYHLIYNPPKVAGKDDISGEDLIQRADDAEEVVRTRLLLAESQMLALVNYYSQHYDANFHTIDGLQSITKVQTAILHLFE